MPQSSLYYSKSCLNTITLQFIFIFYFVKYTPITMAGYEYPPWGEALGFLISTSSMIWVPGRDT